VKFTVAFLGGVALLVIANNTGLLRLAADWFFSS
jgi:hypothetical protein